MKLSNNNTDNGGKHNINFKYNLDQAIEIPKRYLNLFKDKLKMTKEISGLININLENEINRVIAQIKKQEYDELQKLINAYKLSKYKPYQVTGDDTEKGSFGYTKYNTDYNRIGDFS